MARNTRSRDAAKIDSKKVDGQGKRDTAVYRKRVYDIVRGIPAGRVMTYGQLAIILGEGYTPRTVGYVMHASEQNDVPWQRVINSQGACSTGRVILPSDMQQRMLENEGIKFDANGRCDLNRYRWITDDEVALSSDKKRKESPTLFRQRSTQKVKPARKKETKR